MKKVSIVAPVYKSETFLPQLIESILGQTYTNWELIMVDDGSPDQSGEICDNYASSDNRIKVIHQKNAGVSEARNTGLKAVTGYYLTFVDGDDWFEPDCIEYLVGLMENNDCQMAMTDSLFTTSNRRQNKTDNVRIWSSEEAICRILYTEVPVGAWNKIYTTEIIKKNNISFPIRWFGEGLYFSIKGAEVSNKVAVGHKKVYDYRLNNPQSGTTVRKVEDGVGSLNNIRYIQDHLFIRTSKTIKASTWHIHRNCFNLLWFILGEGRKSEYNELYTSTRKELLALTPAVFLHSEVNFIQKCIILLTGLFPRISAQIATRRRNIKFKKG